MFEEQYGQYFQSDEILLPHWEQKLIVGLYDFWFPVYCLEGLIRSKGGKNKKKNTNGYP